MTKEKPQFEKKILHCKINNIYNSPQLSSPNYHYSVWDGSTKIFSATSSSENWVRHDASGYHTKETFDKLYPEGWEVIFNF